MRNGLPNRGFHFGGEVDESIRGHSPNAVVRSGARGTALPCEWEKSYLLRRLVAFVWSGLVMMFLCGPVSSMAALNWQAGQGGRSAPISVPSSGKTGFSLLPSFVTGISFTNTLSAQHAAENQIRLNGSGVAAGDIDSDGWCDLYFCSLEGSNKLFRNLGGWRFVDITSEAGVGCTNQWSTGAVFADIDGDGDLDLLVNSIGDGTHCFINDGTGHFHEATDSGLVHKFGSTSMALADIDGNGTLDLYVANYRTTTIRSTGFPVLKIGGKLVIPPADRDRLEYTPEGMVLEHGEVDFLYRNDGQGHFTPLAWTDGAFLDQNGKPLTRPPRDWGLTVAFRDLNHDLAPDIYVCNDFHSPDRMWINDGHGHFRTFDTLAIRHTPTFSMAVDFADLDRDGHDDFLALDMLERSHSMQIRSMVQSPSNPPAIGIGEDRPQIDHNTLQWNRGDQTYADVSRFAGLDATGWSWSLLFLDVDLDGYEDVLIATGNLFNPQDLDANQRIAQHGPFAPDQIPFKLLMYPPLNQPRLAFRNRGDLTFEDVGARWGFDQVGIAHGMALADLDNDGDLDLTVNNMNAAAGIYRNDSQGARVGVRLRGLPPNTRGIGAKIKVIGGAVVQSQEMICGGRYLSGDEAMRVFAAGSTTNALQIAVEWRSGRQTLIEHAQPNRVYELDEGAATVVRKAKLPAHGQTEELPNSGPAALPSIVAISGQGSLAHRPWFQNISHVLNHTHYEKLFDDFLRQPLLPNRLSQLGPGVSWFDVDGDGWEDLFIGSGCQGQLACYHNDTHGGFERLDQHPFHQTVTRDQTGVVGCYDSNGRAIILAGSSSYEDGLAAGDCVRSYQLDSAIVQYTFPGQESSSGPLALADTEGKGVLDLFLGGRVMAGKYPAPASSLLFRNEGNQWILKQTDNQAFRGAGLVSAAIWSDLDGDGFPELVLACEWGPLRVFSQQKGRFKEVTKDWGLDKWSGWWNGVSVGDFDGDGRMDLVASNWGLNTVYRASEEFPRRIYYGDFDGNGTVDLIEAAFDPAIKKWVPTRDFDAMAAGMPFLRERFNSHKAYADASVDEVLGDKRASAQILEVNTLNSMVLLNRGHKFEAMPLPSDAQFSPAFGLSVADFDGDGKEDIFMSQNFFATQPQMPRNDAGRGLLLKGDGTGHFRPVPGQESGIQVYGEQRGCACADFDHDGRVDLVVTQNGARTILYHNATAKPGLRVRLVGPPGNRDGIGCVIRLRFGDRMGPSREVHAGSGYWSQDAATQVMAKPEEPTGLDVRWPGGRRVTANLPKGANEVRIDVAGMVTVLK